ncbi:MAG TPA: S9 family peptidase [Steroidobacteraceae bacterium]|nr:S9 family peptidase [Steroidobacteraceae bacterium]
MAGLFGAATPVIAAESKLDDAVAFGALEAVEAASLSVDGRKLIYVGADTDDRAIAVLVDLTSWNSRKVAFADGRKVQFSGCDWSANDRVVCTLFGVQREMGVIMPLVRTVAMDADGKNQVFLGQRDTLSQYGKRQVDGEVVDWLNGRDGMVLMSRTYLPEKSVARLTARTVAGLGVDRIDTRTGKAATIERPGEDVVGYISDGMGNIRIMTTTRVGGQGYMRGVDDYFYRRANERAWHPLGSYISDGSRGRGGRGMIPLAVDGQIDSVYVLQELDGRDALYRIALDGSLESELVFASQQFDVADVVRVGRSGRVIGAAYASDRRQVKYFDPEYEAIHALIERALPKLPLIEFVSASADEQVLLVRASSDVEPGNWYVFDRELKALRLVAPVRPALEGIELSPVEVITYPAADGTLIPAYLTRPAGMSDAKGRPAIVLPHGGPGYRDVWGFDWLAQFFAHRGYVVLQPNFRGSSGYGDEWFANNGFQSWRLAVGDVCDGGRWLVSRGIADPAHLAVFGWSYGGYAALQANVLDPNLFKAVIAVAPVTDLKLLRTQRMVHTSAFIEADYIGDGPHLKKGSPARNARAFKAPVLMFHGDSDFNVDLSQSRRMDKALRSEGKSSELVVYPDLEHSLRDGAARADMLRRSDAFLRDKLKL